MKDFFFLNIDTVMESCEKAKYFTNLEGVSMKDLSITTYKTNVKP